MEVDSCAQNGIRKDDDTQFARRCQQNLQTTDLVCACRAGDGRPKKIRKKQRTPPLPSASAQSGERTAGGGEMELEIAFYRKLLSKNTDGGEASCSGDVASESSGSRSYGESGDACGRSITSSAASMTGRFVQDTLVQAIADGVGMAMTPSNASMSGSRNGSQAGEDCFRRGNDSDTGSVGGSSHRCQSSRKRVHVDGQREEGGIVSERVHGNSFGLSEYSSAEAALVADGGQDTSRSNEDRSDRGFDDRSVTSSAASMTGRLVHETMQQALNDSLDMALSTSAASGSQHGSVVGQPDGNSSEIGQSSCRLREHGETQQESGSRSAAQQRKMKLAAQQTAACRLPLHLLCANHAITCKALALLLEAAPWAAAVPDRHGLLPLHVLCTNRRVSLQLLEMLLAVFPAGARMPCSTGQYALHYLSQSPAADAHMLGLLLRSYPQGISILGRNGSTVVHLLAASKVQAGARRLRGGALEGTDAEVKRRRRRQEALQVAVDYDNRNRELEFDRPSGPRVGYDWKPVPTKIRGECSKLCSRSEELTYRRVVPCVVLSAKERASRLRDSAVASIQNLRAPSAHEVGLSPRVESADTRRESEHVVKVLQYPVAAVVSLLMTTDAERRVDVEKHISSMRSLVELISSMKAAASPGWNVDGMGRIVVEDGLVRMCRPQFVVECHTPVKGQDDFNSDAGGVSVARHAEGGSSTLDERDAATDKVRAEVLHQVVADKVA